MRSKKEPLKSINVLQVVNSLDIGGLEKVVINLVNYQNNNNIKVSIVCLEEKGALESFVNQKTNIFQLDKNNVSYGILLRKLIEIIRKNKIKVLHCHNYAPLFFGVIANIFLLGKLKIVYTEHNQVYSISKKHYHIFKCLLKFADQIVCVSKDLQNYFYQKKLCKNCIVVWNGIPFPDIELQKIEEIRKIYHPNENDFIVGTAVVMSKQKGLFYLVQAAKNIVNKYTGIKFLMVGDGPLKNDLESEVKKLGIQTNFYFPGYKKDVQNYLRVMDTFLLPSLWEGLSIVLLEANALGLPIITTDVGGNREIINNEVNGLLIPAQNPEALEHAIEKMYLHKELRNKLAENAENVYKEKFTVQSMVQHYNNIYESLI